MQPGGQNIADGSMEDQRRQLDEQFRAGLITEEEYDSILEAWEAWVMESTATAGEQYSYAGISAKNADKSMLQKAEQMRDAGMDNKAIRQETGWFVGMDGKWRFEIDDSEMKYHQTGDAQFSKDHEGYRRYRELERKFIDTSITDEELAEMTELRSTWANEAPRLRQMVVRGNAKLYHVLTHDALFEQYPQLRDTGIRFGDTDDAGGWWDQERNEIVLSNRYRRADPAFLEGVLLHEIQHAIQSIEGFANGANPEYWENIQNGSNPVRKNDYRIAKAEREAQDALKGIPPEVAKDFWYAANMRDADPEGAERLENELFEGEYSDAYSDYSWAIWTLQDLLEQENPKRTAKDLYLNTAGEIEARDAVNRQRLDAETRKKRPPVTGDERTVFSEGNGLSADYIGKTDDGIEVYETSDITKKLTWAERKKVFLNIMRQQYRGRTAKFVRNGHAYYAKFAYRDVSKNIYGDNTSDDIGRDAKINVGADGNIFELIENSKYSHSENERGKTQRMHRGVNYWDYYVKTVQIDGRVFDVIANIRKKADGEFVYFIELTENKKIEPSSPRDSQNSGRNGIPNSSKNSIEDIRKNVKEQFSISETVASEDEYGARSAYQGGRDIVGDIAEQQARKAGFPVIQGQQIVPLKTWVHATDVMRDKNTHEPILDEDGNPRHWDNYGIVTGLAPGGRLWVHFENKHESYADGKNLQEDMAVAYEDLTPVSGAYQMTDAERESLDSTAPLDPNEQVLSAEEQAEVDALLSAAQEKEGNVTREEYPNVTRAELKGKAREGLERAERKLLNTLGYQLGVSRMARRENLLPVRSGNF